MPVRVMLSNRWARFLNWYPEELVDLFSYRRPGYFFSPKFRSRVWDGRIKILKYRKVPAGAFLQFKSEIEKLGIDLEVTDARSLPEFRSASKSDRAFQNECVSVMKKNSNCGGIIKCATGAGKTRIAGMYLMDLRGRAVFIVDELTLLDQAKKSLEATTGETVGVIGEGIFAPERITVATVQTLHANRRTLRFKEWARKIKVVIIDELHEALSKRNVGVLAAIPAYAVFGLTATLQLQKKEVLLKATALCGPVIYEFSYSDGVKKKFLSPGVCVGVDINRSTDSYYEPLEAYKKYIVRSNKRNTIVEDLVREAYARDKHIVVLVEFTDHIRRLSERLSDIPHKVVSGVVKKTERVRIKQLFDKGKLRVVITNKVFKKGVDIPAIDFVIEAANRKSANDVQQKFGRGTRNKKRKAGLIYIDIGEVGQLNRFRKSTASRRRTLKGIGVPVKTVDSSTSAEDIIEIAEAMLKKLRRSLK